MAQKFCERSLVYDLDGTREGYFHHFKLSEFFNFTSALHSTIGNWGNDCVARNMSCGKCYYLGGSGGGSMSLTHQVLGPFDRWHRLIADKYETLTLFRSLYSCMYIMHYTFIIIYVLYIVHDSIQVLQAV